MFVHVHIFNAESTYLIQRSFACIISILKQRIQLNVHSRTLTSTLRQRTLDQTLNKRIQLNLHSRALVLVPSLQR